MLLVLVLVSAREAAHAAASAAGGDVGSEHRLQQRVLAGQTGLHRRGIPEGGQGRCGGPERREGLGTFEFGGSLDQCLALAPASATLGLAHLRRDVQDDVAAGDVVRLALAVLDDALELERVAEEGALGAVVGELQVPLRVRVFEVCVIRPRRLLVRLTGAANTCG